MRQFAVLYLILIPLVVFSQPGNGNGNGNGSVNGPPCEGPNPPPSCECDMPNPPDWCNNAVPVGGEIWLLAGACLLGIISLHRSRDVQNANNPNK